MLAFMDKGAHNIFWLLDAGRAELCKPAFELVGSARQPLIDLLLITQLQLAFCLRATACPEPEFRLKRPQISFATNIGLTAVTPPKFRGISLKHCPNFGK